LSSGETTTKQLRQQRFLTVKAVDVSEPGTVDFPLITSMQDKVFFLHLCFSSLSSSSLILDKATTSSCSIVCLMEFWSLQKTIEVSLFWHLLLLQLFPSILKPFGDTPTDEL
jgi:hypothetical protein